LTTRAHSKRTVRNDHSTLVLTITTITVVAAVAVGAFVRAWLIFHTPINSDEAVVGLMARDAAHGHFSAFYWGQNYGGTAETEITALFFLVLGPTALAAKLTVAFLSAVSAVLAWRITRRLVPWPAVAAVTGALVWAAPFSSLNLSVTFYGFRGATLVCGLGLLLVALRILDGRRRVLDFALLGLLAGVGWWSSPEIAYYLIPSGLLLIGALVTSGRPRWRVWIPGSLTALVTVGIGALPWLWANVNSSFSSINQSTFSSGDSHFSIATRLRVFFGPVFPTELGIRSPSNLAWIVGKVGTGAAGEVLFGVLCAILIVALVLCLSRPGRALAIVAAVLCFPFVYALSPASAAFANGRYGVFLPPLLAMVIAMGTCEAVRRLTIRAPDPSPAALARAASRSLAAVAAVAVVALVFCIVSLIQVARTPHTFTTTWGNPDRVTQEVAATLERDGVTTGYADYWVAYKLDFLSQRRLTITTIGDDTNRSYGIRYQVLASKQPAWLFAPMYEDHYPGAGTQFSAPVFAIGPDRVPEGTFLRRLHQLGIGYRVIHTSLVNAVIPDLAITPVEAQMPGA
jgi:hypothetical protein